MNQENINKSSNGIKIHLYEDPMMLNITPRPPNSAKYEVPFNTKQSEELTVNGSITTVVDGCATLRPDNRKSAAPRLRSSKSTSALNSNNNQANINKGPSSATMLDETEIYQIERFYMAHKTFIYVSRCMANLYFTKTDLINEGRVSSPRSQEWKLERTGVPVIIFDKGETRARDKRQLKICLAERGTGFNLWSDIIDNLTDYKAVHPYFHTLYLSCDHRKMAGLSFDSPEAASEFLRNIEAITCDPLNIALSAPKRLNKKEIKSKSKIKKEIFRLPAKKDISSPCLFQHVINVDTKDFDRLFSITSLVRSIHSINASVPTVAATLMATSSEQLSSSAPPPFHPSPSPVASTTSSNSSMTTASFENSSNCSV